MEPTAAQLLEASLAWWRDAGLDSTFADEPASWLEEPRAANQPVIAKPKAKEPEISQTPLQRAFAGEAGAAFSTLTLESMPDRLDAFRNWWMSDPALNPLTTGERVLPIGEKGSKLLTLIAMPSSSAGQMLPSDQDQLLMAMLRALGVERSQGYLASALPAPTAMPDWQGLADRGLGKVVLRHVQLAEPKRVLVFGRAMATLFGVPPENVGTPTTVGSGDTSIPMLFAPDLTQLARSPERRRTFWKRWLEWTA